MNFPVPFVMKFTKSQQYHVRISSTEFHPNRTTKVESTERNTFAPTWTLCLELEGFSQKSLSLKYCLVDILSDDMRVVICSFLGNSPASEF